MAKVIVITGANGSLGSVLSTRFGHDGEHVVLLGRDLTAVQRLAAAIGGDAYAVECDVGSPSSVRAAFAAITERHPRIDVLINNAAVIQPFLIAEATDAQIVGAVMTNLAGPILCARAAIPLLNRGGHIINISSESVETPVPHLLLYQCTKVGLERFSRDLSAEIEELGIRVSIVRPGQMASPAEVTRIDPVAGARLLEAALKRGIDFNSRGVSQYESTTYLYRAIIDSPPDVRIGLVAFEGRRAD